MRTIWPIVCGGKGVLDQRSFRSESCCSLSSEALSSKSFVSRDVSCVAPVKILCIFCIVSLFFSSYWFCKKDDSRMRSLEAAMMWCDGKNYKIVIQSHFLLWLSGLVKYNVKRSGAYVEVFELLPSTIKLNYGLPPWVCALPCFVEKSPRREELKWSRVRNHVASWWQVGVHDT